MSFLQKRSNVCFVVNLETDSNHCLEHHFYSKFNSSSLKQLLYEEMNFLNLKCFKMGFANKAKTLLINHNLIKAILKATENSNIQKIKIVFIMDEDYQKTKISLKKRNERVKNYKNQILSFIKKKNHKKLDFKLLKLPKDQTFEYLIATCLNDNKWDLTLSANQWQLIAKLYEKNGQTLSVAELKKKLVSDENILLKINEFLKQKNQLTNIFKELRTNLFQDKKYLIERKKIKNEKIDTYHYLFDWWI